MVLNERVRQFLHVSVKKHTFVFSYVRSIFLFHIAYEEILRKPIKFLKILEKTWKVLQGFLGKFVEIFEK